MKRRFFFKAGGTIAAANLIPNSLKSNFLDSRYTHEIDWNFNRVKIKPNDELTWKKIGNLFPKNKKYIQLENGYFSHQALPVLHHHQEVARQINEDHSIFMRLSQETAVENARKILAEYQECNKEEIAFTRNTTESLNIVIMGFPWQSNDEVVMGNQDYGSMIEAFEQAKNRWGISIKVAEIPIEDTPDWEDRCLKAYLQKITEKTKMVHLTHPVNLNGQGIPLVSLINQIRHINPEICIVVDAAHALSHFPETIGMINADVIGSSLHKWTGAPLGLGCLYVGKKYIEKIWPLMGDIERRKDDIRKFEHQGTRPIQTIVSLEKAIEINIRIGIENRRNRLKYLKYLWQGNKLALEEISKQLNFKLDTQLMHQLQDLTKHPKISFLHPLGFKEYQGAMSTFQIESKTANELAEILLKDYRIFTVAINHPIINGVRITPQLSNSVKDVLSLNQAISKIVE